MTQALGRRLVLLVALLLAAAAPAAGQAGTGRLEGLRLVDALRVLQARGLRIVFSSGIVTPDMRVASEPRASAPRAQLDELMQAHGLRVEDGPGTVLLVVRGTPVRPDTARQPGAGTGAIEGHVVDAATGSSLADVLVQIVGSKRSARTDKDGRFLLPQVASGTHTLYVSMVGYGLVRRPVRIAAGRTLAVTVALAQGTGTYTERVTVTAPQPPRRDPGVASDSSLGSGDLQNLNGVLAVDAMRAVQTLPRVATGDDFRSEFSVRGSPYRHVGVVVDGVATPWLRHAIYGGVDTGSVAMLNSDVLDQATLQAGAYPLRYGDRLGAQLDVTLREGSRVGTQLRGAVSGTNATLVVEGPLGRSKHGSWLFTIRQTYLEWPTKLMQDFSGKAFGFTDAQAKLVYDVRPSQQLSVSLLGGRSRMDERGERLPNELALGTNRAGVVNLGWRSTLGSTLVINQRAYLVAHQFSNTNQEGQDWGRGTDGEIAYRIDLTRSVPGGVLEAGGQVQQLRGSRHVPRYAFGGASTGPGLPVDLASEQTWGPASAGAGILPLESVAAFDASEWQRSGYAHVKWAPTPRLTIAPGLRVTESTLVRRTTAAPWMLGEWSLGPGWALNASAGVSHQFPVFEQVLGGAAHRRLAPERATHVDLGIEQRPAESIRWQVTLFNRHERDILREPDLHPRLVDNVTVEPVSPGLYENALRGSSRGVELLVERRSASGLSGWLAYSFGRTRHTDTVRHETFWADFDQRHLFNASGVYRLSDRTSVAVKFRGGSNFPVPGYLVARDGGLFVGAPRNTVRLPAYARLDVRANRTFTLAARRLTLFIEVLNVLNRTNVGLADGFVRRRTGEASGFTETLFPRLPAAGILIEF